ncbi:hypothetical protein C3942_19650 [Solimonas fluminis]|uniref:DUF883 domain-containing protein n=1 Tax=Solimonas fluminis TaxID=2086571 RepID=A0A2S5TB74_9GAMM|nr:hypothetical protein [Solimonas fluminis]PPE72117.1 hypothetical protein C3942_19650 [Solimonas fluminis]
MSRKQKKVALVGQHAVDELFDRADGLVTEGLSLVEQQLRGRIRQARRRVDSLYERWPGGSGRAISAATQYLRNHPVQAAGICVGAGVVALAVANRQAAH